MVTVDFAMGGTWDVSLGGAVVMQVGGNLSAWFREPGLSSGLRSLWSVSVSCCRLKALAAQWRVLLGTLQQTNNNRCNLAHFYLPGIHTEFKNTANQANQVRRCCLKLLYL